MALVNIGNDDPWITEQNACERLCREIQNQIILRNREPSLSPEYTKISAQIRLRLKQITNQIDNLNKQLTLAGQSITNGERERRQRQIEELQSKFIQLRTQFTAVDTSQRGGSRLINPGASLWQNEEGSDEDDKMLTGASSDNYSIDDMKQQQVHMIRDQDRGLDSLAQVISRQKQLALRIGEEVESQNDILDELADQMENTDNRVSNETRNIGQIVQRDSTCGYWVVIAILFVAILLVTFL